MGVSQNSVLGKKINDAPYLTDFSQMKNTLLCIKFSFNVDKTLIHIHFNYAELSL